MIYVNQQTSTPSNISSQPQAQPFSHETT
uniref:Uncharacterized protein n=1 Tax=Rhizophora mucronata TaxID=61149 RepID=A0A2P2QJ04_RHIMU